MMFILELLFTPLVYLILSITSIYLIIVTGFIKKKGFRKALISVIMLLGFYGFQMYKSHFDSDYWIKHDEFSSDNPRFEMVKDLMKNHLKRGMSKAQVIALLGQPGEDKVEMRTPDHLKVPDSATLMGKKGLSRKESKKIIDKFNNWHNDNARPTAMLLYPIGGFMDMSYLAIRIENGRVANYRVEQH